MADRKVLFATQEAVHAPYAAELVYNGCKETEEI